LGDDVVDVRDVGLGAVGDEVIFRYAVQERRTLVSADKGFTNTLRFPLGRHAGIVVARFPPHIKAPQKTALLCRWIPTLTAEELHGALVVMQPRGIRIRRSRT